MHKLLLTYMFTGLSVLLSSMALGQERILHYMSNPVISPQMLEHELDPLKQTLKKYGWTLVFKHPKSWRELEQGIKNGEADILYTGFPTATYLINHYQFQPILESTLPEQYTLIEKKIPLSLSVAATATNPKKVFIGTSNHSADFYIQTVLKEKAQAITRINGDNILIDLLRTKNSQAIIDKATFTFLPESLQNKIRILDTYSYGPIMHINSPNSPISNKELERILLDMHQNWQDPENKYHYLNVFQFRTCCKSKGWKNDEMQTFIEEVMSKQ